MDEVESFERMILLDPTKQVDATVLASMALDGCAFVHDDQLLLVGCDLDIVGRNNPDEGEESSGGLPALGTPADVVVKNVAGDGHLHTGVAWTMAVKLSTRETVTSFGDPIVDQRMKRGCHGDMCCSAFFLSFSCLGFALDVVRRLIWKIGFEDSRGL